jgi:hypothetical protein
MFLGAPEPSKPYEIVREEIEKLGTRENQVAEKLSYFALLIGRGGIFFRARPGCQMNGEVPLPHDDVGPNPCHPASRANADGQYSIYLSEKEKIAIAEIKQLAGSNVSVGKFFVNRDITVVDLCQSFETPNPFVTTNLPWILDLTRLLEAVAGTMSKPAQSYEDYNTTRLLADISRAIGYDGIRYPSALDRHERNIVLFDPQLVHMGSSWVTSPDNS